MNKNIFYFIITILISFGAYFYVSGEIRAFSKEIDIIASKQQTYNPKTFKDKVQVISPKPNTIITSPVKISGSVSGTWFFEGQVISRIIDEDGTVLGQGPLVATDDWMTVQSVGFSGIIPFDVPSGKTGFVIIEADNPSGSANPPSFKIPVSFATTPSTACVGSSCGECTIGSIGTNGVCMHDNQNSKS